MTDKNPDHIYAPFTDDQVESLNAYQKSEVFHPFTGLNVLAPEGEDDILVATPSGWISNLDPSYTQNWAWVWMGDWSWKEIFNWKKSITI